MAEPERRRRRLRPSATPAPSAAVPAPGDETAGTPAGTPVTRPAPPRRPTSGAGAGGGGTDDREAERGLRGLVGSGSSQVSVGAAMRARDAARPTDEQLADADTNLPIVRRNWQPREELPKR
ncbi:hypothetical protein HH310_31205 [Actinoplanes sp. TBRC 11911]|uniref:hypothetical protein n=1 Tax=Actinoplanes sp. TBRC 11911 TaxID=2729386 RepID=UPI00145EAD00|nr:hypothetical protein [Actinoplanes sp. TBRC 11911]NMO55640.1 hypothetical protein [Actinoplanes sp. TBRC 11911]